MAGVLQQARGSGGGADGGDQARGRHGPAGSVRTHHICMSVYIHADVHMQCMDAQKGIENLIAQ